MNQTIGIVFAVFLVLAWGGICFSTGWHQRERGFRNRLATALEQERLVANDNSNARVAMMEETQRAYFDMKPDVEQITLFLRANYATEIERGYHANRKLGELVCAYLAIERQYTKQAERQLAEITTKAIMERRAAL